MKQIKKYSGILILTFLFIHCEKDIVVFENTTAVLAATPDFKVKTVSAKQLSKIIRFLEIENHIPLFQKDTIAGAIFDMDNIVEVIDGLNTTNYSLRFVYPDTPEHIFYNLVVGTDGQGEYTAPYVLKYECDASQLQAFVTSNYNFHYFKGTISYHRFTDFFQGEVLFSKTTTDCTEFDQYGDPLACEEVSIDGSGPSGSGGSAEVGGSTNGETVPGTGSPGGTGGFSITVYHIIPSGDWYVFGPGSVCQHPGECEIVIAMNGQDNQQRTATECPPCTLPTGGVGVSMVDIFDDQIFIDDNFKNNECLYSVYEAMGKATTFKNYLQNFDSEFSVGHLRFSADDNFKSNRETKYHNAMAITAPPLASNLINITFNTDPTLNSNILTKPDVYKAVAMIHEMLHAEMFRKMLDAVATAEINQTDLNWRDWPNDTDFDDFIEALENKYFGIFDYYTRYDWDISTPNNGQHQAMAQHYRDIMKQALTDYDATLTEQQKEALSWLGLKDANIVAWQNLPEEEKDAVNTTLAQIKNTFPNGCD